MMRILKYPQRETWEELLTRPDEEVTRIENTVDQIMATVRSRGDQAIHEQTSRIDGVDLENFAWKVNEHQYEVDAELKNAIRIAEQNIRKFHQAQVEPVQTIETTAGVKCWRKSVPIEKVGLYIPGGSAPLFSTLLMLAVPARIAGSSKLVVCTPPQKDGSLHPVIGYVCQMLEIDVVFLVGGAQAVAGMTYGTPTIPKVDKIFGPGNQYVTIAKQMAQKEGVAIDMPAGPSEVLVIADDSSNPSFVAADLLSQAEHGADSQVILVSDSESAIENTLREVDRQLKLLPRKEIAERALNNSKCFLVKTMKEAFELSNVYAPEHLILSIDEAEKWTDQVVNAGSVFVGHLACESAGDYASGTNHTLPTNGYARAYSGVSLDSFMKKITFQSISEEGINNLGPAIEKMAAAEQLEAHKNAVSVRLKALNNG